MFGVLEWGYVLALLSACLIALVLVLVARREATAVRRQAIEDSRELRDHLRDRSAEVQSRHAQLRDQERDLVEERRALRKQRMRLTRREETLKATQAQLDALQAEGAANIERELERISGISREAAKASLERRLTDEARRNVAATIRAIQAEARNEAEARAKQIIVSAVERLAVTTSSAAAVTTVTLPSEEMRGRIIGKEGRNIRTFEATSGVDVLIEDNSSVVVLASFDPMRREIAQAAMAELVSDGRINPQRIEDALTRATDELELRTVAAGRQAAEHAGVHGLADPVIEVLGRLRLRTSFGQSVLAHSLEVGQIAAHLAEQLGADIELARRGGLLHDIGKAFTGETPGTHAANGAAFLADNGEDSAVVSIVAAHHDEIPHASLESVIVQIADGMSAARPGARKDETEHVASRIELIERVAVGVPGVAKALAMAAGRELRVIVEPSAVSDDEVANIAAEVAQRIEAASTSSGVVTVTVIKELRAVSTAGGSRDDPLLGTRADS